MNLADIRKKAQRERLEREASFGAVTETDKDRVRVPEDSNAPRAPGEFAPGNRQDPDLSGPAKRFDPLGVIMAGREAAGAAPFPANSSDATDVEEEQTGLISFDVCGESHALQIDRVKEIIRPRRVTVVPRMPDFITGILSHRGAIIPVLDLAQRLGHEKRVCSGSERIIVIRSEGGLCGLQVDRMGRFVRQPLSAFEPVPVSQDDARREFVSGITRYRGSMLILLDIDKVLDIGWHSTYYGALV